MTQEEIENELKEFQADTAQSRLTGVGVTLLAADGLTFTFLLE
jgi:hypothetical protein